MRSSRIYLVIALLSLGYLPYVKLSLFYTEYVQLIYLNQDSLHCNTVALSPSLSEKTASLVSQGISSEFPNLVAAEEEDSVCHYDGQIYWLVGTESLRFRTKTLYQESPIFRKMIQRLAQSDYPLRVKVVNMESAIGVFSSFNGELRFSTDKMQDFFFDATLIEEFAHAYQALYYGYGHGLCRSRDYQFAFLYGDSEDPAPRIAYYRDKWERFGRKHAYIESEAKLICYLIQQQSPSIDLRDIALTDEYNSGAKAKAFLLPYLKKRNCLSYLRPGEKLHNLDDYYIDLETFMRYQNAFVKYWRKKQPGCSYAKGRFIHKPEALQTLTGE